MAIVTGMIICPECADEIGALGQFCRSCGTYLFNALTEELQEDDAERWDDFFVRCGEIHHGFLAVFAKKRGYSCAFCSQCGVKVL